MCSGCRLGSDHPHDYVEVQVHGGVSMQRDVEAVVLDPCFRSARPSRRLHNTSPATSSTTLVTSPAPRTWTRSFPTPRAVQLAGALGVVITPTDVGAAANAGVHDAEVLKHVWHLLARFGRLDAGRVTYIPAISIAEWSATSRSATRRSATAAGQPLLLVHGLGAQLIGWADERRQAFVDAGRFVIRFDNR
ncbi:MAG: DUF3626 domain-containing protein [Nibricoccus sp.]